MIIQGIVLITIAVLELALGLNIYYRDRKNAVNITFLFTAVSVVIWVAVNSFIAFYKGNESEIWYRLAYFSGVLIASSVLYFTWVFPYRIFQTAWWRKLIVFAPIAFFTVVFFLSKSMIIGVQRTSDTFTLEYGGYFPIYVAFFVLFFCWAIFTLIVKYRRAAGMHRWQLKYVLISILIPFLVNLITDMFLPLFGFARPVWMEFVGSELSVVWLGLTAYVAFKKKVV